MSDKEKAIDIMLGFSIDKMYNTVQLLEGVVQRHGMRHGERMAELYCNEYNIPALTFPEFMSALGSAMQRKLMLIDPNAEITDKTIIH